MKQHLFLRGLAFLLCLSIVLGIVSGGILISPVKVNAVPDSSDAIILTEDFETAAAGSRLPEGWTANEGAGAFVELWGQYAYEGRKSLIVQERNGFYARSPKFAVVPGCTYTATFMETKYGYDGVTYYDGTGGYAAIKFINGDTVLKTVQVPVGAVKTWTENAVAGTAPADATAAYVEFGIADKTGNPTYTIDNLVVTGMEGTLPEEPEQTDPVEIDNNWSFENLDGNDQPVGWRPGVHAGGTFEIVTEGAFDGNNAVYVKADPDAAVAAGAEARMTGVWFQSQKIDVTPGSTVELTAMGKLISGTTNTAYAGLWFYDANNNLVPENTAYSKPLAKTNEWTKTTVTQAVPAGAAYVIVEFGNPTGAVTEYLVDDITFTVYDSGETPSGPTTPTEPVDPSDYNWSFENLNADGLPVNWFIGNGISTATVDDAPQGSVVAQLQSDGSKGSACLLKSNKIPIEAGKTYQLKIMAKVLSGGPGHIGLFTNDANGAYIDAYCIQQEVTGAKWKMYSVVITAPAGAATMHVEAFTYTGEVVAFQVDGVLFTESDSAAADPWTPGEYNPPVIDSFTGTHPYLYFNEEELEKIKAYKDDNTKSIYGFSWKSQFDSVIRMAEGYLVETEVQQGFNYGTHVIFQLAPHLIDPNDPIYDEQYIAASKDENGNLVENPHLGFGCLLPDTMRTRMEALSLAYVLTGDTRYSDLAIRYAVEMSQWEFWGDWYWLDTYTNGQTKADASNAWATQGVAAVYDMCHDQLTEEEKEIIETAIVEKGLVPLSQQANPNSIVNGNCMLVGGMLTGVAAIINEDNYEQLKPYLDLALTAVNTCFGNYAYSGNTEGHYYSGFGLDYLLPGVSHMYRATGVDELFGHPLLNEMLPYWTVMFAAPGTNTHPNYSDGGINVQLEFPMAVISKTTKNGLASYFLTQTGGLETPFQNLVYLDPDPVIAVPEDYVAVVNPIGYGGLRTGFANNDMLLTLLANNSHMSHNHYDQNSIQFNVGGDWIIGDPGSGSYYYADRTFWTHNGHSTILVDDNAQSVKGTGSMQKVFGNELYGYIIGSAPDAYGSDYDAQILEKFDRHAIQVNHDEKAYYILIDDLASSKEHTYSWQMFNGERVGFSVDGEMVPEMTTAEGNDVSMIVGAHVLNLSFVDSDKLSIADKIYVANGENVGYTLLATSAASKTHQFMTVISSEEIFGRSYINFAAMLNGVSSETEHIEEGGISWKTSNNRGVVNIKGNTCGTLSTIFFRGSLPGDYIKLPFTVEETGTYDATLILGVSDGCCEIKAYIGDVVSDVVDCCGLPETSKNIEFKNVTLEAGQHYVTVEVVGPSENEVYAGIDPGGNPWGLINAGGLILNNVDSNAEEAELNSVVVAETYDDENALGALINYAAGKFDLVMFNRTEGLAAAGKLSTDGQQASVLGLDNGKITEGFAATNATKLIYDGKTLFEAAKALNIVADADGWHIDTAEAQTVKLNIGAGELLAVTVNGEKVDVSAEDGMITLKLEEGASDVAVEIEAVEPEYIAGDVNGDGEVTDADAIYLLYATFDPDGYPLNQKADLNGDGEVTDADAIYLLYATFDPDGYPLT